MTSRIASDKEISNLQTRVRKADHFVQMADRYWSMSAATHMKMNLRPITSWVHEVARLALELLETPPQESRRLQSLILTFDLRRTPNDPLDWWGRHRKDALWLMANILSWKPRSESESVITIGAFRVHDTIGMEETALRNLRDVISQASRLLEGSCVQNARKVLYGDILVTNEVLKNRNAMAFYDYQTDRIYLHPLLKPAQGKELLMILHELGHRYYRKVLTPEQRSEWIRHDDRIRYSPASRETLLPKVGDTLPFLIPGMRSLPKILEIQGDVYYVGPKRYLSERELLRALEGINRFPTPYSKKSDEEHFCETLALFCMGRLEDMFAGPFRAIVCG